MPPKSTPEVLAFRRGLIRWFRRSGRDLPWRHTRDPYRVLVSEVMLQQTQVSRVTEYYARFLARFPSLGRLAAARPAEVREAWDGLGYYRRASNLHRLARVVVREHAGHVPADPAVLKTLPGIGRYTAGAVASFAFERRAAAVDTNVGRVIRRAFLGGQAVGTATTHVSRSRQAATRTRGSDGQAGGSHRQGRRQGL